MNVAEEMTKEPFAKALLLSAERLRAGERLSLEDLHHYLAFFYKKLRDRHWMHVTTGEVYEVASVSLDVNTMAVVVHYGPDAMHAYPGRKEMFSRPFDEWFSGYGTSEQRFVPVQKHWSWRPLGEIPPHLLGDHAQ